ncbi:hypothetical protein BKA56DRAFT_706580, partial [Ilyonectria sp. MPI-CAGE-AT-0026]
AGEIFEERHEQEPAPAHHQGNSRWDEPIIRRIWQRITEAREGDRQRIYALLRWVAFALRPLTVCEVTEAVLSTISLTLWMTTTLTAK